MTSKENNRAFGLLFFIFFILIGLWPLIKGGQPKIIFLFISAVFLFLAIMNSKFLSPLNKFWIKFGELLGRFIAPIVMAIIYFIILTPLSIFIRACGKDLLKIKFLKNLDSYWIKRSKNTGPMNKQF
jgi:hypothetical protein